MLTTKEKIVYETLKRFLKTDIYPSMVVMRKQLKKKEFNLKSNNSLCQYYARLQIKGYIEIIHYQIKIKK